MARILLALICALLFVAWVGEWPVEIDTVLYSGLWRSPLVVLGPLFVPLPGIRLFAWQLLLLMLTPACMLAPGAFRRRSPAMDGAMLTSVGSIALTFVWGWMRGGSAYMAYWQLWRFLTALLVGFVLSAIIRSPRDLRAIAKVIVIAGVIRGSLVMYFYWVHVRGKIVPPPEYMINHDDSLLFVATMFVVLSWAFVRGTRSAIRFAAVVALHQTYAIILNDRRLAYVELAMGALVIYLLMGAGRWRRRINRWALLAAPAVLVYVAAGWGREGAIFAPVQALSSVGSDSDPSSLGRQEEIRNLLHTMSVAGNPLLGTGWGVPYQKVTSAYANYAADWVLAPYTPHNSLVGLAAFSGLVGLFGVWLVVPVAAFAAARGYRQSIDPVTRAAAMVVMGVLPAYAVQCYGDIGLQSFQCGLFLGVAMAVASRIAAWRPKVPLVRATGG